MHVLLRREGWLINVKRVRRLYNLEGLQMRLKPLHRRPGSMRPSSRHCVPSPGPRNLPARPSMATVGRLVPR
jgi:putative transposase